MDKNDQKELLESLKLKGNTAVKEGRFAEAVDYYNSAINVDSKNYILFSNRSYAHLLLKNYLCSINDARIAIDLNPTWPKGYFRQGEVEYATGNYKLAVSSYKKALSLQEDDPFIIKALDKCVQQYFRQQKMDKEIPWVFAGIGIVVGVILVYLLYFVPNMYPNPLFTAFVIIIMSLSGYAIGKVNRYFLQDKRERLLNKEDDGFSETEDKTENKEEKRKTPRYSKSQANMRYRKGNDENGPVFVNS